jgi:hypothetical protein
LSFLLPVAYSNDATSCLAEFLRAAATATTLQLWPDSMRRAHLEALVPSRLGSPLRRALAVTMTGMGATSTRKRGRPTSEFPGRYYFDFWRTRIRKREGIIGNGIQPSQYCTRQSGSCDDNVRPSISDSCVLSSFRLNKFNEFESNFGLNRI